LVNYLIQTFNIERKIPRNYLDYYGTKLKNFNGVIGHVNVREDKSDPLPDNEFWNIVIKECQLQLTDINGTTPQPLSPNNTLTLSQIDQLFQENLVQFSKMNRAAGNLVKALLWELQDVGRNTYIRLRDAVNDGHVVSYDMVQGDPNLVNLAAESLGFKSWNANRLEVHNA
jgi:hypothetical protein